MEIQRELPLRPRFRRRSRGALYLACAYWSLAFVGYPAFSQPVHRNLWGNTGMIDMPSARISAAPSAAATNAIHTLSEGIPLLNSFKSIQGDV